MPAPSIELNPVEPLDTSSMSAALVMALVDRCYAYDNSLIGSCRSLIMSIKKGEQPVEHGPIPQWARKVCADQLGSLAPDD